MFEGVLPWLGEQGLMDDDVFSTIFVENPRRWLAGEQPRVSLLRRSVTARGWES